MAVGQGLDHVSNAPKANEIGMIGSLSLPTSRLGQPRPFAAGNRARESGLPLSALALDTVIGSAGALPEAKPTHACAQVFYSWHGLGEDNANLILSQPDEKGHLVNNQTMMTTAYAWHAHV